MQTDNEDEILEIFEEDSDELANFLKKWEPIMLKALQENRRSHAFDGYDVIGDNDDVNITSKYTLKHVSAVSDEVHIAILSWMFDLYL